MIRSTKGPKSTGVLTSALSTLIVTVLLCNRHYCNTSVSAFTQSASFITKNLHDGSNYVTPDAGNYRVKQNHSMLFLGKPYANDDNDVKMSTAKGKAPWDVELFLRKCKLTAAAAFTVGTIFLSPLPPQETAHTQPFLQSHNNNHHLSSSLQFRISTTPPSAMAAEETPTSSASISGATLLDEVWTLIDKYYIDRTFHNQNWSQVRTTYVNKVLQSDKINQEESSTMKLTTEMVQSLGDKYSRILDKPSYARIQKFDLIGVGATLMPNPETKRIMVGAPPVHDSAAEKGGIHYGDYIIAVNGMKTEGRTAFEIIDQISEVPDARTVTMTVLTEGPDDLQGEGYVRDVTMNRQFAEVKNPIEFKISERRKDGTIVGYVRVKEFNSLVKTKLEEALVTLEGQGANAYVLDMRSNPGGAFQSAVEVAGLFMSDKIATSVVDSNQVEMPFKTTKDKILVDEKDPVVIWLDGGSASATEVLAGALHDQCRAVVMGSNSFGKGLIQAVYGLKNGGGLVLTVARYVTPNGTDIQGQGLSPDIQAKLPMLLIPGVSSDTSQVNFVDVSNRLSPNMCPLPQDA